MLKTEIKICCLLFMVLAFLSCQRGKKGNLLFTNVEKEEWAHVTLQIADSIMEEDPERALELLRKDSAEICQRGTDGEMGFILLKIQAEDKLFIRHDSDSIVRKVVEYFDKKGDPIYKAQANYVLGRVYCDMYLYGSAMSAFKKVLDVDVEEDPAGFRHKARACSWMGFIYEEQGLNSSALYINKLAYTYACKSEVAALKVYALRDIARSYNELGQKERSDRYFQKAALQAKAMSDTYLQDMVLEEYAFVLLEDNKLQRAREIINNLSGDIYGVDSAAHFSLLGKYQEKCGKSDSAIYYYTLGMRYAAPDVKAEISLLLAKLYKKLGNEQLAYEYFERQVAYNDFVKRKQVAERNDYMNYVEKALDSEKEILGLAEHKTRQTLLWLMVFLVFLCVLCFLLYMYKKRGKLLREQKEQQQGKERQVQEGQKQIARLEKELGDSKERNSDLQENLRKIERQMADNNRSQLKLEEDRKKLFVAQLESSSIYKQFHDPLFKPSDDQYAVLVEFVNRTYDDFTLRLKNLCPTLSEEELRICCLIKIGLLPKQIGNLMSYESNKLSMKRSRLYKKVFKKKGCPSDFDNFIYDF